MCHVSFDNDELIEDTLVDVNQINNNQSDGAVDSNFVGVTRIKPVSNQEPDAMYTIEISWKHFSKRDKIKMIVFVIYNMPLSIHLTRL